VGQIARALIVPENHTHISLFAGMACLVPSCPGGISCARRAAWNWQVSAAKADFCNLLCYDDWMNYELKNTEFDRLLTDEELVEVIARGKEATHLQEMVSNPLSPEQIEMFAMFDRERWSHEKRRAYIAERWKTRLEAKE
jgi:hypothetical protein